MSFQSASKAHGVSNREAKGFLFLLFILITPFLLQYGYRALFYVPHSSALPIRYLMDSCEAKKEFQSYKSYSKEYKPYSKEYKLYSNATTASTSNTKNSTKAVRVYSIIELNAADSLALESLPGIGPSFASRILKYRKLLGGYVRVEQLKEVYGMPEETYDRIKPLCTVDVSKVKMLSAALLWENPYKIYHPYLSKEMKAEIKQLKGKPYSSIDLKACINKYDERLETYMEL